MPTGYTFEVQTGKIADLRSFALQCSRAFGAAIMLRDHPISVIPTVEMIKKAECSHSEERLAERREDLARILAMTPAEVEEAAVKENRESQERYEARVLQNLHVSNRYNAMLAKVEAWTPPTQEHEGLKKFMIDQLRESIRFDIHTPERPELVTAERWLADEKRVAEDGIAYYSKEAKRDAERAEGRVRWFEELVASLPVEEVTAV